MRNEKRGGKVIMVSVSMESDRKEMTMIDREVKKKLYVGNSVVKLQTQMGKTTGEFEYGRDAVVEMFLKCDCAQRQRKVTDE